MNKKIRRAIIPAAGLGTRFLPATISCPKEMLTVVDKPVIQYIIEEAVSAGIEEILIITRPGKEIINRHFDPSSDLIGALEKKNKIEELDQVRKISKLANIQYINQLEQKGLADAVYCGKKFVGDEPFALLLGDTIIFEKGEQTSLKDMVDLYEETGMSSVSVEYLEDVADVQKYGILDIDESDKKNYQGIDYFLARDLVEKPSIEEAPSRYCISCRYVFTPEIFKYIEQTKPGAGGELQITDSMKFLAEQKSLLAYLSSGKKYDIGNKLEFVKANIDFALANPAMKDSVLQHIKTTIN